MVSSQEFELFGILAIPADALGEAESWSFHRRSCHRLRKAIHHPLLRKPADTPLMVS